MNTNQKENIPDLILEIQKTNPQLAASLENFRAELNLCKKEDPEFQELLKNCFPNQTFSDVCKRLVNTLSNSKLL
jgi:protoporphyrinogen oxidase